MKWDYKLLIIRDEIDPDKMASGIIEMGKEGWEAVSFTPKYAVPAYMVLLKRPVQE